MLTQADPPKTKDNTRSFRVDLDLWARFHVAARARNRSRGEQLNELMKQFTEDHERGQARP